MSNPTITKKQIREANEIYVLVTFTGDDESWVYVSKVEMFRQWEKTSLFGYTDSDGILWISQP